ncbi:hypothetical protein M378DRAFT_13983 [Amanita muscaria Koide BX008]|uniref:BAR-domain-containing protein n=1 Tax=Amanita muscaria (strain Koide BX008) TaxID=946122 RepID=A0A0C2T2N1_AMAMK|nr:hypothetical protein M378DRAFT_13983 [Amanita muscaria Koide BX008]
MASRQLGKLRQWAGEVIASREKTTFGEEFKDLERDIEFRREGSRRLYLATETYQNYLSKKKLNEALDEAEKLLPIDALGVVMIVHGEEYHDDSVFGNSLVKLGRSHCKIATLQEAFASTVKTTFLTFLSRFEEEIKEYDAMRKKLESRRLSYDAALAKTEKNKNSKKEKERREAEEELERAQYRYEKAMEDVRAHMHAIQENEAVQHRELTSFLDAEINYVQQYLDVLIDVKSDWQTKTNSIKRRDSTRSQTRPPSQRQTKYSSLRIPSSTRTDLTASQDSSDEEEDSSLALSRRRNSSLLRKSETGSKTGSLPNSRPSSRAGSRASRKRSDSAATVSERDKDVEKDKAEKSKRKSVAVWASSAVGSVANIGWKNKDKDRFSALEDHSDDHLNADGSSPGVRRLGGLPSNEKTEARKKVARAVKDFRGFTDELSFKEGDIIIIINEVLDEWWLGSLNNQTGLFPSAVVEIIADSVEDYNEQLQSEMYGAGASDVDEDGDLSRKPLSLQPSPFYTSFSDVVSITSSGNEDEESKLMSRKKTEGDVADSKWANPGPPPIPMRRAVTADINAFTMPTFPLNSVSKKSAQPPPPPPRRLTTLATMTPPIPERKVQASWMATSTSSIASSQDSQADYNESPFESASDFASNRASTLASQNPF